VPDKWSCIGSERFVRNVPDGDWVCSRDLPKPIAKALAQRFQRNPPAARLPLQDPIENKPISTVPAFTLLGPNNDGKGAPWAVTINDYGPDADSVSTILTFDTKEEAEAFIVENKPA
jgi:hypothetical protein